MENMMRKYIGAENYSYTNHVKNFCLYWIKASKGSGDEWRKENDLDCLYFNGDLRADTLISAWTPIKWVADFLNKDKGKKFYKHLKNTANPCSDLELLYENCDTYLPCDHELVHLLEKFLTLAEQRCNYILLPDRKMNCDRYHMNIDGKEVWLYDSVPATLYHVFNENTLGKYFTDISPETWIKREHLTVGFVNSIIDQDKVIKMPGFDGKGSAKWLEDEESITKALQYMIAFLEARNAEFFNIATLESIYAKLIEHENKCVFFEDKSNKEKIIKKVYASNVRRECEEDIHMKIYCMSDIHGFLAEFEDALEVVLEHLDEPDTKLCLLGDYIHGGGDGYRVLDKIMELQNKYGTDKVIALLGNHEDFVLAGYSTVSNMNVIEDEEYGTDDGSDDKYISWFESLPRYYTEGNTIFVHAGIEEDASDMWEWATGDDIYVGKYPAETGKIEGLDMKVVAGHIGTCEISGDPSFHDIYYDGESHYYIDGTVIDSRQIPVLLVDTDEDKYYQVTESGNNIIFPYDEY